MLSHIRRSGGVGLLARAGGLTLFCVFATGLATAQPANLPEGINASFENPEPERYVQRFETESRSIYKYRFAIVEALGLKPGMDVADVGAGTGFFSRMMAKKVGDQGTVYAVDIAQNFLDHITKTAEDESIANIKTVLCDQTSSKLPPDSVDLVYICDTYHHFERPEQTMASIHEALRPGGVLIIVDFERVKGVSPPFSMTHVRCGRGTVTDEVKDAGFDFVKEVPMMKDQYIIRFVKREGS